jgi:hypothetical protein
MLMKAHQCSFDLYQGFPLFRARNSNADSFQRFGPELANLDELPTLCAG